ncbi:MAG TPA: hypothetical protein VNN09_09395 [Candidatus Competibacteraceae bacterium]|nr:hypothetical protein [Candidatus Competibacteraceae bacterium]
MKIKMKALSVAVGATLGVASLNANADALLFPFFQSGNGAVTYLSLHGDAGSLGDFTSNSLHYVWNYNDPVLGTCTHFDLDGSMSQSDLIQQSVSAPGVPGGDDLDTKFGDASNPAYLTVGNTEGFLTVEDDSLEGGFRGQAIIVNVANGTVTAYKGLNNPASTSEADFNSLPVSHFSHDLTWYPTNVVDTAWFLLVTGTNMNNLSGWRGAVNSFNGFGGVFNRDEVFASGGASIDTVCYDTITVADFTNAAQQAHVANGGYAWLINAPIGNNADPANPTDATGALMVKIESSDALGPTKTAISLENAFPNFPY